VGNHKGYRQGRQLFRPSAEYWRERTDYWYGETQKCMALIEDLSQIVKHHQRRCLSCLVLHRAPSTKRHLQN